MNVVILLAVAAGGFAALWAAQTALLVAAGEPWRKWPLRHRCEKPLVRWGMKAALQGVLLALLFGYPAVIGEDPLEYHKARLHPANWWLFGGILASAVLAMCPMFVLNVLVGWVRVAPHYDAAKSVKKVIRCLVTPIPLAFVEEALFRGVVLDALLRAMPGRGGMIAALVIGAAIFASVHFFRPQKRLVLPALGLFGLGVILGAAYVLGGHSYWLPVAIHAGGVVFIQVSRPFVEYKGPAWLIGYSSYPICGLLGVTSMALYVAGLAYALNTGLLA
jgi:Type II CAAX prenyl endopeptidase Rce1-like